MAGANDVGSVIMERSHTRARCGRLAKRPPSTPLRVSPGCPRPTVDVAIARACLLALTLACIPIPAVAAEPTAGASPAAHAAAAPTLFDVVAELGRADAMQRRGEATLRDTAGWKALAAPLDDAELASDLRALEGGRDQLSRARYLELVDADTRLRERVRAVNAATAALGRTAQRLVGHLDQLRAEEARWPQHEALARDQQAPAEIQRQIEAVGPALAALQDRLRVRRDELLVAYGRAVGLEARFDAIRAAIAERRVRINAELRGEKATPIWRRAAMTVPVDEIAAEVGLARRELAEFLREHGARLAALFFVPLVLCLFALRRAAAPRTGHAAAAPPSQGIAVAGALLVGLMFLALLAPRGPFAFYRLIPLTAPLLAGVLATRSFAAPIPATAWALMFAVLVKGFRVLAEMNAGFGLLLLALEVLPVGAAVAYDWRRGGLARFLPGWPAVLLRRLVQAVLAAIAVAIVAETLGHVSFAQGLATLVVTAPGFALILAAAAWALDRVIAGLLTTPLARSLRSVRERGAAIERALHWFVVWSCWAVGIFAFVLAHGALEDLRGLGAFLANASVSAGDVTIGVGAILSALAVVVATWLLTKVVRFALLHEILPRLDLRAGVPIAISTVVSYLLILTGFVLALAALGIDLTKVTLLAGALGVGVGLGLQSVVNNFASGLILMLERPINVGDQVDVGGVLGEVRRIGVRSSTIRTSNGAEVIVPNSDLATKQVTNWTLSDRARRYEIDVGVAYGSDPAQVLQLLEGAVANLPEVQKAPAPRALFVGFGDSSLDFRIFAWVESVDIGLQAQNAIRMAILRALDAAGIEIPFPQRDLHVRWAGAAPGLAPAGTPGKSEPSASQPG